MGFDGSSITGFNAIEESDMVAMPDPSTFRLLPWRPGAGRRRGGADVRRHPDARARALRGRSAPRPAPRRGARQGDGLRPLLRRAGARVLPVPRQQGHRGARRGRLLRPHDARRRLRRAARDRARAREARHRRGVLPPRGRPLPARDRHALRRRAEDGRRLHDVPHHGQGVRDEVRLARDVHAQAAVRRERLGDAHAPVAVQGRPQRLLRRRRPVLPLRHRQGVHRRPAAPRARDLLDLRPVGELLQAPGAGLRGAGLRRLVAPQPLRARARRRSTTPAASRRRGWSCAARTPPATPI